ncbi:hypothetical protein [Nocardiopsis kunsanensis]|uniref:hypothetical protein n=1 Tax=Nocardiopsis kunsanensis TaxID=141693 RepID=UPI0018757C19|nr:hypothetical protein [Nocardiopsis kunsanensis]
MVSIVTTSIVAIFFAVITVSFGVPSAAGKDKLMDSLAPASVMSLLTAFLFWWAFSLCVLTGVEVRPGWVIMNNLFTKIRIPSGSVSKVTYHGGLHVHTDTGEVYRSTAFPNSLFSLVIGYRNFRVVARRIEAALAEQPRPAPTGPAVERTELRGWLFWWLLGGLFSGYLIVFVLSRFVF